MEALAGRQDPLVSPSPAPLLAPEDGGREGLKFLPSNLALVFLATSPHPKAS